MNGMIETRMGRWTVSVQWSVAEADVAKLIERSVALAFPAQLQAKDAGGRVADMKTLEKADIEARFAKRVQGDTKVVFGQMSIKPWEKATPTPTVNAAAVEKALAAGTMSDADLLALLAKRGLGPAAAPQTAAAEAVSEAAIAAADEM